MAVVFISPKSKQKAFLMWIVTGVMAFIAGVAFFVFTYSPTTTIDVGNVIFNKPKVTIDLSILDSDRFKNLNPFDQLETQFSYNGTTDKGKISSGIISAININEARKILVGMGLLVIDLKPVDSGRLNPFTPYYQKIIQETPNKTTTPAKTTTVAQPVQSSEPQYQIGPDGTIIEVTQ
jgi:hypothetical protein